MTKSAEIKHAVYSSNSIGKIELIKRLFSDIEYVKYIYLLEPFGKDIDINVTAEYFKYLLEFTPDKLDSNRNNLINFIKNKEVEFDIRSNIFLKTSEVKFKTFDQHFIRTFYGVYQDIKENQLIRACAIISTLSIVGLDELTMIKANKKLIVELNDFNEHKFRKELILIHDILKTNNSTQ
jgi:hypothetical protein